MALRSIASVLFLVFLYTARAAVLSSLPPFAIKLIVVEDTPDLANSTEFRNELSAVAAEHLERSLTYALVTPVEVTVAIGDYLYAVLDDGVGSGDVVLSVVNVGFQGIAEYDGVETDIIPLAEAAFSQDTGFWDFAKAVVNNDLLKDIAKLQVAMDNEIVGEGNLVPDDSDADTIDQPDDEDTDSSNTALVVAVTICTIVSIVLVVGCIIFWRYNHELQLERKKAEKRQLARQRRMMDNDLSGSYASRELTSSIDSGLKKSPTKTHKPVISKPSKEARKERRLLRIIEQSEEGSDDKDDDQYVFNGGNEGSILSLQSCQSSLTASLTCSPKKLAKGWKEEDVPAYMRNTRGFHTGTLPEKLKDSPKPAQQNTFPGSPQKVRTPPSWGMPSSSQQGPFSQPEKVDKLKDNQLKEVPMRPENQSPTNGVLKQADSNIPIRGILNRPAPKTSQKSPQPAMKHSQRSGVGHESLANLNFSGSAVSNQHSISSASSNCDHSSEAFLNDGPRTPPMTKQPLSMAHDSVALIKSKSPNKKDVFNDEVGIKFEMSCANFNMDDSDMFEDSSMAGESINLDEFNDQFYDTIGLDKRSEHSMGITSIQSGSNNSSKRSTSKGSSSASWRFT